MPSIVLTFPSEDIFVSNTLPLQINNNFGAIKISNHKRKHYLWKEKINFYKNCNSFFISTIINFCVSPSKNFCEKSNKSSNNCWLCALHLNYCIRQIAAINNFEILLIITQFLSINQPNHKTSRLLNIAQQWAICK